jgi:mannose-1-phosphate guanylyltransferase
VKDLIIVETKDALLICKKGRSQDVKKIVEKLEAEKTKKYL